LSHLGVRPTMPGWTFYIVKLDCTSVQQGYTNADIPGRRYIIGEDRGAGTVQLAMETSLRNSHDIPPFYLIGYSTIRVLILLHP
jgi:hypothetical protein